MKSLENLTISMPVTRASGDEAEAWSTLMALVSGKKQRGDDVIRAALWLVEDVLRRTLTPYFRRGRLRERIRVRNLLAKKWTTLLQCWPGGTPPSEIDLTTWREAGEWVSLLMSYAPQEKGR